MKKVCGWQQRKVEKNDLKVNIFLQRFSIIAGDKNYNNNIEHRTKALIKNNMQPCGLHVYNIEYTPLVFL